MAALRIKDDVIKAVPWDMINVSNAVPATQIEAMAYRGKRRGSHQRTKERVTDAFSMKVTMTLRLDESTRTSLLDESLPVKRRSPTRRRDLRSAHPAIALDAPTGVG